ncbi:hypothetical protein CBR_g38189 [Chara braunii]|uniref:Sugar phosphate transporter domain-containing protein n=1 Tax=Chara braunii TaxID=69332 RepID=A0A388LPF9_CHABU|nr:hypothetical protein CBR_g38189 [Chara braunii]|eukprot:GBG84217.1 hypothetical protein CBR_g38189 [Chara braunii]
MAGREVQPRLRAPADLPRQESLGEGGVGVPLIASSARRSIGGSKGADASARDRRIADISAWIFNISTSVGVIMVNKQLLSVYKFGFVRYSRSTKLSIVLVLLGVGICTVSDITVNAKGFLAACIAVVSTSFQQYFFIILSCLIAVGTNLSQFICIGRFSAVGFQVLGHMKTVLVLVLGYFLFGKEMFTMKVLLGITFAIVGMVWYGNVAKKDKAPPSKDKPTVNELKMSEASKEDEQV